jgi:hypothetical protein
MDQPLFVKEGLPRNLIYDDIFGHVTLVDEVKRVSLYDVRALPKYKVRCFNLRRESGLDNLAVLFNPEHRTTSFSKGSVHGELTRCPLSCS